jgi:isopentenyl-diphosphate delta-isomerase
VHDIIPAWVNGKLKPLDKLEVHERALKHKAVSVFIIAGNETLIQQRALHKYHTPGLWTNSCCTHPHWNELPNNCAIRRINEELGIKSKSNLIYRNQIEYKADVGNNLFEHELVDIFTLEIVDKKDLTININALEVMSTRWIDFTSLQYEIANDPHKFTPWLKIYLNKYTSQIRPSS